MNGDASKNWPIGYGASPQVARKALKSSWIGLITSLKRSR